jgi:nucleotide-binding universal stress UspA family protein
MAGDIILGYDGSEGSKAALAIAVSVAHAFDATLSIVFGYEPNPMGGETADYKDKLEKIGETMVAEALAAATAIDSVGPHRGAGGAHASGRVPPGGGHRT